jgi:CHAT domain-containing protein
MRKQSPLLKETVQTNKEVLGEKHTDYAQALNNLAIFYQSTGNYTATEPLLAEALKIYREALGDKNKMTITTVNNLAKLYFDMGNYAMAESLYQEAIKSIKESGGEKHPDYALYMKNLAVLYRNAGNNKAAEPLFLKEVQVTNDIIKSNSNILSEKEKELYVRKRRSYFSMFYSFSLQRKKENPSIIQEVYNNVIKNKGLLLKSSTAMRSAILGSGDTGMIAKYNRWINLNKELSKLYSTEISKRKKDPEAVEKQANDLEKELVRGSQVFRDLDNLQNVDWKTVQQRLKAGEAAIEYVHFTEGKANDSVLYCALLITPKSSYPEMIALFDEKQLTAILGTFQGNNYEYINSVYGKQNENNLKLYSLIWKPAEKYLQGVKTIYLSPSGLLHKISFAAISSGKNVNLCDNYNLYVMSSTAKVAFPERFTIDNSADISIYGGIIYNRDSIKENSDEFKGWNYLEGSKTETEKISGIVRGNKLNVNYFTGKSASEAEFKSSAGKSSIIHIATHGFFYPDPELILEEQKKNTIAAISPDIKDTGKVKANIKFRGGSGGFGVWAFVKNKNPLMRSGLVFAGANAVWKTDYRTGNEEDGVLTAAEVATMDLRKTGLVVLSACETGLGDIKGSEGVYGLQRAFKMAGVKFMIMSLWQVPDKETSEFMVSFYTKLNAGKDIKKAFSETQKELREKYDPYFWAAFVLVE